MTYGGTSWRDHDDLGEMAAVLSVLRRVHEMLAHLGEVGGVPPTPRRRSLRQRLLVLRDADPGGAADRGPRGAARRVRRPARGGEPAGPGTEAPDLTRADLAGQDLRRRDLRGAGLRGAVLIGADLRGVDLGAADLLGADLRDADLRGAALADALFLTGPQLEAARGDAATTIPAGLRRPAVWAQPS